MASSLSGQSPPIIKVSAASFHHSPNTSSRNDSEFNSHPTIACLLTWWHNRTPICSPCHIPLSAPPHTARNSTAPRSTNGHHPVSYYSPPTVTTPHFPPQPPQLINPHFPLQTLHSHPRNKTPHVSSQTRVRSQLSVELSSGSRNIPTCLM